MTLREKESQRVTKALLRAGVKVDSVFDLVNSRSSYKEAIPVLVELLPTVQDTWIKEGVVRALAVKEAVDKGVDQVMVREFEVIDPNAPPLDQGLKWAIANTISVVARDSVFEKLSSLARDKQHGKAREMLVVALGNMKKTPEAINVLIDMLSDDVVVGHAAMALGKLKATQAIPALENLLDHPKDWVRKEAERAIKKISKGTKHVDC